MAHRIIDGVLIHDHATPVAPGPVGPGAPTPPPQHVARLPVVRRSPPDAAEGSSQAEANKRRRAKIPVACEACRKRRSRCDLIDANGCHRCKQLGSECSFAGSSAYHAISTLQPSAADSDKQHVVPIPRDVENQLDQLRLRVAQLEQALSGLVREGQSREREQLGHESNARGRVGGYASVRGSGSEDRAGPRDEAWYREWADPEAFGRIHGGIGSKEELGLRDPVAEGVISVDHAEAAYQIFKHHITTVFPFPSFLLTRSRLPSHPFLRSACLTYATRCSTHAATFSGVQIRELEANLTQNLMAYHRGCRPSLESIMAGVILSLLPHGPLEGSSTTDFDPARMIGMAYGQIRELGYSVFVARLVDSIESGTPFELIAEAVDNARLHLSVMTRAMWHSVSRNPSSEVPTPLNATQKRLIQLLLQSDAAHEIDKHLFFENAALDILLKQAARWHELERVLIPGATELRRGNSIVSDVFDEMLHWRSGVLSEPSTRSLPSLQWLLAATTYYKWWAATRNVWFAYRLASPLVVPQVIAQWEVGMELAAEASNEMITRCIAEDWDLKTFPKSIGTALILCFLAISMARIHHSRYHADEALPPLLDIGGKLDELQVMLERSNEILAEMLLRTRTNLDDYRRQLDARGGPQEAPFDFTFDMGFRGGRMGGAESGLDAMDPFAGLEYWWNWQLPSGEGLGF
ncbi:Glucose transport transcription regulator RGT1 [Vanrija pseudolonga]|uniref:Glucose transport transcription regulator RGT1 n=1 Tax=Vanrija pseudolonga TaxID=143232 RepID=A0AAF0YIZ1_9TREE|nr:Glucose transport transcription regulator RGT1 [Vanrija pseudolonga]